jgi:hypothetical protein
VKSTRAVQAPAGGRRWNDLEDRIRKEMVRRGQLTRAAILADGFPPGYDAIANDPRAQYEHLIALRAANDPRYWNDPSAVKALSQLVDRFGPPPAPAGQIPPFPGPTPQQPMPPGGP